MTRAVVTGAVVALLALSGAAPASAKRHTHVLAYDLTAASISEDVHFQGDGGAACARDGVCGYSGEVSYQFSGIQFGDAELTITPTRHGSRAFGFGEMQANGLTKAVVNGPGGGQPCTDQILRHADLFVIQGTGGRVRFSFHSPLAVPNYISTICTGPSDDDLWHSGALPRFSVPVSKLRTHRVELNLTSQRPFHAGPFTGTLNFSASLRLRRIRLPAGLIQLLENLS